MKTSPFLPTPSLAMAGLFAALSAAICLFLASSASAQPEKAPWNVPVEGLNGGGGFGPLPAKPQPPMPDGPAGPCLAAPASEINPQFSAQLYQQLRATKGNVFYSPYSITQAMGMVYMGAKGDTAAEFAKVMGLPANQRNFGNQAEHLRNVLHGHVNRGEDKLNIANALCVTGQTPKPTYLDGVKSQFDAEVFSGGLDEINGWVKNKTDGHIEKILNKLSPDSACVLLNAVYFKGTWKQPFRPSETHERDFHVTPQQSVKVKMMSREGDYAVVRSDQWTAVELPYKTSCSMVLVMPAKAEGMKALEEGLGETLANEVLKQLAVARLRPQEVVLQLPKFKIATEYDLIPPMKGLGLVKAFDARQADFTAMYDRHDISIAQIVHKATLEVDEQGSVATAATAIEMTKESAIIPQLETIRFDRPFLVLIRENNTNSTLFMGRISDPTK